MTAQIPPEPESLICPICQRAKALIQHSTAVDDGIIHKLICPYCGKFRILQKTDESFPDLELSSRLALSCAIRRKNFEPRMEDGRTPNIYIDSFDTAMQHAMRYPAPLGPLAQLDRLLDVFAEFAPNLSQQTPKYTHSEFWTALIGLPDKEVFHRVASLASTEGFIQKDRTENIWSLSLKGWHRVNEIREIIQPQVDAFVAMWFHPEMDRIWQFGFHPALADLKWNPVRIDREHFLNRIDDEILRRIRRSGILIADITGARHGVYFEAGFALGLGIPVIWTCNETWRARLQSEFHLNDLKEPATKETTWMEAAHFDTKTFQHVLWTDAEDLKQKLSARLEALDLLPGKRPKK